MRTGSQALLLCPEELGPRSPSNAEKDNGGKNRKIQHQGVGCLSAVGKYPFYWVSQDRPIENVPVREIYRDSIGGQRWAGYYADRKR